MIAESGDCGSNKGLSGEGEWPIAKPEAGLQLAIKSVAQEMVAQSTLNTCLHSLGWWKPLH